jgi:hypothetical protein
VQNIETHNHNVLRLEGPDGKARYVVADSFYQNEPYKMSFVQDQAPEVVTENGKERLRTSGGYVDAVVCEREPDGSLKLDKNKKPIPVLDENKKPVTRRTRIVLETTGYSDAATTKELVPTPEDTFNGRAQEPGQKRLVESLVDPQRNEKYGRLAELAVAEPAALGAKELLEKPGRIEEARAHVANMRKIQTFAEETRAITRVSRLQTGVAAFGLAQSVLSLHDAAAKGDKVEAGIAGVNLATSAASTVEGLAPAIERTAASLKRVAPLVERLEPAAARVLPAARGLGKLAPGLNIATTLVDGAYQISKEDTLKHKEERAAVVGATAATGIAVGAATTAVVESAAVAAAVGAGGAAVLAVAAPVVVAGVAVYAVAKVGEAVLENKRKHDSVDEKVRQAGVAGKRHLAAPVNADGKPSILEYNHIVGALQEVSPDLKDSALGTTFARGPGGHIKPDAVKGFDLGNPKNFAEVERALNAKIAADDKKIKDNSSILPNWLRFSDSVGKQDSARLDEAPLKAARAELEMFKREMAGYAAKQKTAPAAHKAAATPPVHTASPSVHTAPSPVHTAPSPVHNAPPPHKAAPPVHQAPPPVHKVSPPIHLGPSPAHKTTSPPVQKAGPPAISHYKNLPYAGYVLKDTPSKNLNGRLDRTPDGYIKNFRDLDMTDPKNLKAYSDALDRRIEHLQRTVGKGGSLITKFLPGDHFRKSDDPKSELRQLQGAKADLVKFENDLRAHRGEAAHTSAAKPSHETTAHAGGHHSGKPDFFKFKNLAAAGYVLKSTPDAELHGRLDRTPDKFIKNFRELDMSDPKNIKAFDAALKRRIATLEKAEKSGALVSSFIPGRDKFRSTEDAKSELRQLRNAEAELSEYKKDLAAFDAGHSPTAAKAARPPSRPAGP